MTYLATVEGVYKSRLYINLILFKIARGWRTDHFNWSQQVSLPSFTMDYEPIKGVPLGVRLQLSDSGLDIALEALDHHSPIRHIPLQGESGNFHWEPFRGVIIDGAVSFRKVEAA